MINLLSKGLDALLFLQHSRFQVLPCPRSTLARIKDKAKKFICDSCYACKGFYMFSSVKASLQAKADLITKSLHQDNGGVFVDAMCKQIQRAEIFRQARQQEKKLKKTNTDLFRVHDSGDLFSPCYIARVDSYLRGLSQQFAFGFQLVNGSVTLNFHTCKS